VAEKFLENGIRFQCQGSGRCCVSRGEYGYVYLSLKDRKRMARFLKLDTRSFTRKYCQKSEGFFHLKDGKDRSCQFLRDKRCDVYEGRPTQCRTWPFWPEVMNAKSWKKEVAEFCPGVGKGPVWSKAEIQEVIDIQESADLSP